MGSSTEKAYTLRPLDRQEKVFGNKARESNGSTKETKSKKGLFNEQPRFKWFNKTNHTNNGINLPTFIRF